VAGRDSNIINPNYFDHTLALANQSFRLHKYNGNPIGLQLPAHVKLNIKTTRAMLLR
jgi:hypothetical protein